MLPITSRARRAQVLLPSIDGSRSPRPLVNREWVYRLSPGCGRFFRASVMQHDPLMTRNRCRFVALLAPCSSWVRTMNDGHEGLPQGSPEMVL